MSHLFPVLLVLAMVAAALSLFGGLFVMARGRAEDGRRSNTFMRWRVVLQAVAVLLFALAFLAR